MSIKRHLKTGLKPLIPLVSAVLILTFLSGCMEPVEIPDAIPQERMRWKNPEGFGIAPPSDRGRWPNPHGWGLEPETEAYNGIFY